MEQPGISRIITASHGFRKLHSFGLACIIYHATAAFCRKYCNLSTDPLGKIAGQMLGAARSARQNIVEGSSRAGTSRETEIRLYDVARASLEELAGDYEAFILETGREIWEENSKPYLEVSEVKFGTYGDNGENLFSRHAYGIHFTNMRKRFAPHLENPDLFYAANAILVAIDRTTVMLWRLIGKAGEEFLENGGFSERMSRERYAVKDAKTSENSPQCPDCGAPMRRVRANRGRNAGGFFWSCTKYPNCKGTLSI